MQVKCFECEQFVQGADADAVVEAFVSHGKTHPWPFPEEALRNYARNYAEANERLASNTERLPAIGVVQVLPVTGARVDDWLRFFDQDGFAGHPDWASCYCLEPHAPATQELPERPWRDTRATVSERLRCGATYGYLAYVAERAVGWVNASLRSDYGLYRFVDPLGPEPRTVVGVSCFVIAPPYRRHGVASALLDHVIAGAAARGAAWIEGYPHNEPQASDAGHFRGPRSLFEARGFQPVQVREHDTVMRRPAG